MARRTTSSPYDDVVIAGGSTQVTDEPAEATGRKETPAAQQEPIAKVVTPPASTPSAPNAELRATQQALQQARDRIHSLEGRLQAQKTQGAQQLDSVQRGRSTAERTIAKLEKQAAADATTIAALRSRLDTVTKRSADLEADGNTLLTEVQRLEKEIKGRDRQVRDLEGQLAEASNTSPANATAETKKLSKERDRLRKQLQTAKESAVEQRDIIKHLEIATEELDHALEQVEGALQEEKSKRVEAEVTLQQATKKSTQTIDKLEAKVHRLNEAVVNAKIRREEAIRDRDRRLQERDAKHQDRMDRLTAEHQKAMSQSNTINQERLRELKDKLEKERTQRQEELKRWSAIQSEQQTAWETEMQQLEDKLRDRIADLESRLEGERISHQEEMDDILRTHAEQQSAWASEMEQMETDHLREIAEMDAQHDAERRELQRQLDAEVVEAAKRPRQTRASVEASVGSMRNGRDDVPRNLRFILNDE